MNYLKQISPIIFYFLILALYSCKKDSQIQEIGSVPSNVIEKLRKFHENSMSESTIVKGSETNLQNMIVAGEVLWNKTFWNSNDNSYITPIFIKTSGKPDKKRMPATLMKYLITQMGERNNINESSVVYIITKDDAIFVEQMINNPEFSFIEANIKNNFNGAIISFTNKGDLQYSYNYSHGKKTNKESFLSLKNNETANNYEDPNECETITIDWYWQTWVNGVLISEEYLYSTNVLVCGGSGGGGGGGGGGGIDSVAQLAAIESELTGIHDGNFSIFNEGIITVPSYATAQTPFNGIKDWDVVDAEYYEVTARTNSVAYIVPPKYINVISCNTYSILFQMKKTSMFWLVNWQLSGSPNGMISYNNTTEPTSLSEVGGYINISARSSWWAWMNSMPQITAASTLYIKYRGSYSQE